MAVPKRRVSKTRRDKRRTHDNLAPVTVSTCSRCNSPVMPHRACKECGYYNGSKVMKTRDEIREERAQ